MQRPRGVEVADIFRRHGPEYRQTRPLPLQHLRVMRAVEACRTAELGGHKGKCADCGHIEISYNSCRNRHCPKCQSLSKERWIHDTGNDLLSVEYFHVVFTVPSELNPLFIMNPRIMYNFLFRSASETLTELADNPKHLGARIGFMMILHTWGQNLMDHPHVHCVVTGAGLSPDNRWVSCRKGFFIPGRVMSALFRGKFLDHLRRSLMEVPGRDHLAGYMQRKWRMNHKPRTLRGSFHAVGTWVLLRIVGCTQQTSFTCYCQLGGTTRLLPRELF